MSFPARAKNLLPFWTVALYLLHNRPLIFSCSKAIICRLFTGSRMHKSEPNQWPFSRTASPHWSLMLPKVENPWHFSTDTQFTNSRISIIPTTYGPGFSFGFEKKFSLVCIEDVWHFGKDSDSRIDATQLRIRSRFPDPKACKLCCGSGSE